jgi:hypothetical protein
MKAQEMKPVNGACPDGYILIDGGEDGGMCVLNPFEVRKDPQTGKLHYDKEKLDILSEYVVSAISKLPKEQQTQDSYEKLFNSFIQGLGSTRRYDIVNAVISGDKDLIKSAIANPDKSTIEQVIIGDPTEDLKTRISANQSRLDEGRLTPTQANKEYSAINEELSYQDSLFPPEYRKKFEILKNKNIATPARESTPVQSSALQDIIASAQPTPKINTQTPTLTPQTPQAYGVQEDPFAGVGAQPIQERNMSDTDKPSLFQGLRNLIGNLFKGAESTTSEQPVNVQAPAVQPQVQQGVPDADIDARMAQMGVVADNVAPGIYTDPNVINAQNVAANAVTGATPVSTNVVPEQTGMFGGGQSGAGSMAQSELGGLSGGTAMPTTEGQPTDVAVAEANTGTIPASVVKPVTATPVTYPGTQTAVTPQPQPSGNLPLNFSFEEDLTAKGKQAGGDVQSQALMDMAQQAIQRGDYGGAEAILRRPLTNQDFFAGPGMRESRTAWGDPIFTGEGQLFPMAVLDARQKAQAQVRNMAIEDDVLNMVIPTVNVAGLRENYSRDFVADSEAFMRDGIKRYGSAGNAIKAMKKSGEWAKHMSKWKATAEAINTTGKMATDFLTKAKEGMQKGDTFASPEALASATMFVNGLREFAEGNIRPERLAQLQNMFYTTESWSKYLNENKDKVKPIEFTPDFKALNTPENRAAYEAAIQEIPVDRRPGYNDWLVTTKIAEVAKPQAIKTLIEPFLRSNPTAFEQFRLMYPGKKDEEIIDALGDSVAQMYGRQLTTNTISRKPTGSMRVTTGGGKTADKTFYQSINERKSEIMEQAMNANPSNVAQAKQQIEQIYGGGTADDLIYGVRAFDWPTINQTIASMPYSELYEPNASDFATKKEVFFGKVNKGNAGIPSETTTAKNLKVQGVVNGFIRKDKDGGIRVYSNEDAVRSPLTADYKPYLIQIVTDEKYESSGSEVDVNDTEAILAMMQANKKSPATSGIYYRFIPLDKSTATTFDKVADKSGQSTGGTDPVSIEIEKEDF